MLNIAICDDNNLELQNISNILNNYYQTHANFLYLEHLYSCGEDLLSAYRSGIAFDIVLLDIYMGGISGIDVANELRTNNYKGQIIFLTSSEAHALEAYHVDACSYLLKPVGERAFSLALDKIQILIQATLPRTIILRSSGEDISVSLDSIVYSETNGHYQEVHLSNGDVLSIRSTVTALFEELSLPCFMLVGKSYIINFNFVKKISSSAVTMNDGTNLFPPRGSSQKIREQYFNFYQTI